jgi:hypothetical protein
MDPMDSTPALAELEAIDRVARATHLWIRHERAFMRLAEQDGHGPGRHNLVAGVIAGLCDALDLDQRCAVLAAYAYALIDSETEHALAIAYPLCNRQIETRYLSAFEAGRNAAADLIAILGAQNPEAVAPVCDPQMKYFRGPEH